LRLAEEMDTVIPKRVVIFAIEIRNSRVFKEEISRPVERAMYKVVDSIEEEFFVITQRA